MESRMTNYERYFGTPERAAQMRVRFVRESYPYPQMLIVEHVIDGTWDYAEWSKSFFRVDEYSK